MEAKKKEINLEMKEINPLKDHTLFAPPYVDPAIDIKKGKATKVPAHFLTSLKTEGVIK